MNRRALYLGSGQPASHGETAAPVEYRMQTSASEPVQGNGKSTGYKAPVQGRFYQVVGQDGKNMILPAQKKDVLAIAADSDFAMLTGKMEDIEALRKQGVRRIIFATKRATSTFLVSELLEKRAYGEIWSLIHDGENVAFTAVEKMMDISSILTRLQTKFKNQCNRTIEGERGRKPNEEKKLTASMIAPGRRRKPAHDNLCRQLVSGKMLDADNSGQTVTQGGGSAVPDEAPVITQRESSVETGNTIAISTSDNAAANVTIKDINIKSSNDAIDVKGSSSANITLEGDNKIFSETGSALHVSDGNVTINGSGSLKAEIQDEPFG